MSTCNTHNKVNTQQLGALRAKSGIDSDGPLQAGPRLRASTCDSLPPPPRFPALGSTLDILCATYKSTSANMSAAALLSKPFAGRAGCLCKPSVSRRVQVAMPVRASAEKQQVRLIPLQ